MFKQEPLHRPGYSLVRYRSNVGRIYVDERTEQQFMSVTTFLSFTSDESDTGLADWRARVGEAEANKISKRSRDRGTELHTAAEKFVTNQPFKIFSPDTRFIFNSLKPQIEKHLSVVYGTEVPLRSFALGLAGTTDLIGEWDGHDSIIDWKNSNEEKKLEGIESYMLQSLIYALMYREMYGQEITQLVVPVFCVKAESKIFIGNPQSYWSALNKRFVIYKQKIAATPIILGERE